VKKFHIAIIAILLAGTAAWFFEPTGWLAALCLAFLVSFTLMHYATRNILMVSYRKKLFDLPDHRRIHKTPIPRLGGLAFAPILCCSVLLALVMHPGTAPAHLTNCLSWICALIIIYMIGAIDDLVGVRYLMKFSAQIIASLLVIFSGFWINDLYGLFGIHALSAAVGIPLTILFLIFIVNAVNLIDGMDGLASSLVIFALGVYGVRCFTTGQYLFSVIAIAALGTLFPFFYTNVWGLGSRRHKLFMGDTGSQTLGLVVGVLAVGQMMNAGTPLAETDFILVFSPLLIPAFDVLHVMLFRMIKGHHPFQPDMTHIHHRLLRTGLSPRGAVMFIITLAAFYVAVNALLAPYIHVTLIFTLDMVIWCTFNMVVRQLARRETGERRKRIRPINLIRQRQ
jgi:UDP-N-acetylmuramyl pentapeptide phosphotransferase/UDP-N-acetylglucosamine-1-phosphate transferase